MTDTEALDEINRLLANPAWTDNARNLAEIEKVVRRTGRAQAAPTAWAQGDYGAVEGRVQAAGQINGRQFILFDLLYDQPVSCHLAEGVEHGRPAWGAIALVEGLVERDPVSGRPVAVREVSRVTIQEGSAGAWRQARGVLTSDEPAEVTIRRIRDGFQGPRLAEAKRLAERILGVPATVAAPVPGAHGLARFVLELRDPLDEDESDRTTGSLLLFAGPEYYPGGGAEDFVGIFDTLERARDAADALPGESDGMPAVWAHVLDLGEGKIVAAWKREWAVSNPPPPGMEQGVGPWTPVDG